MSNRKAELLLVLYAFALLVAQRIGLIFSLEPVFSAILSYIFLHEVLEIRGYVGAVLVFCGVFFSKLHTK